MSRALLGCISLVGQHILWGLTVMGCDYSDVWSERKPNISQPLLPEET